MTLKITALGGLNITLNEEPLSPLASRKADALLVYLVCTGRAHPREKLGAMLWDDRSSSRSRSNLSVLFSSLRKHLPGFLLTDRQSAGLQPNADTWIDAAHFEQQISAANSLKKNSIDFEPNISTCLEAALEHYQGDFLAGFHIRKARGFEEWVTLERERLHRLAFDARSDLAQFYLHAGNYTDGIRHAARLLAMDPYREGTHRQLMLLWARLGQRRKALEQYEVCKKTLADEIGVAPSPATINLYRRIRDADPSRVNLPRQTTPFIGRAGELASISQRLSNPDCHLLTLVGPGGIGKTRLALEAASTNRHLFLDGVFYTPLESLTDPTLVLIALAESLGFTFLGKDSYQEQLARHLSGKETLLVFDNFEHLLPATRLLDQILRRTPDVKILTTSRERLNMLAEWLVEVRGLGYPRQPQEGEEKSDAVRLFVKSAQRIRGDFTPTPDTLPDVIRVCQAVDGSPLGIELAASWIQKLIPREIAAEIGRELDFLEVPLRDIPARHRGLRAVFDHSWNMLDPGEKKIFRRLSIFRGTFSRKAAQDVTSVSLRVLSALVDKSLLQQQGRRYRIHGLLRQYAAEKLADQKDEQARIERLHAAYYSAFLASSQEKLKSARQTQTLDEISLEIPDIRSAWDWAIRHQNFSILEQSSECLQRFYDMRSRFQEGKLLFSQTAERIADVYPSNEEISKQKQIVFGRALLFSGWFSFRLGDYAEAREIVQSSAALLRAVDDQINLASALNALGHLHADIEKRLEYYRQSLDIHIQAGNLPGMLAALNSLGVVLRSHGRYADARQALDRALSLCEQSQNQWLASAVLNNLGFLERIQGRLQEARAAHLKSLKLKQQLGDQRGVATALTNLALVETDMDEFDQARNHHQQSLAISRQLGDVHGAGHAINNLGDLAYAAGNYQQAYEYHQEGLALERQSSGVTFFIIHSIANDLVQLGKDTEAWEHYTQALESATTQQYLPAAITILTRIANLWIQYARPNQVVELLSLAAYHTSSDEQTRKKARELLDVLEGQIPVEIFQNAIQRGKNLDIDSAVQIIPPTLPSTGG